MQPAVLVIPLSNAAALYALPALAAVEIEGDRVVFCRGFRGDLKINRFGRPRPAAVRHGSPCAVLFRAVPERSGLNQQVRFVQTDRTAAGGFQKERTAGKRHGTIADAGPCAHRKAAALHRRSAAQAAVRPGYGDLAAFIHRNAAAVGRFFHIADLQRTINFCTAAGDCLISVLDHQSAAALDRDPHAADAVFRIADLHGSENVRAGSVDAEPEGVQRNVRIGIHPDRLSSTVKSGVPIPLCAGHRAFSGHRQRFTRRIDGVVRHNDVSLQRQCPGSIVITHPAIAQKIPGIGRGDLDSAKFQVIFHRILCKGGRRQQGQRQSRRQDRAEQPQFRGTGVLVRHKRFLLPVSAPGAVPGTKNDPLYLCFQSTMDRCKKLLT